MRYVLVILALTAIYGCQRPPAAQAAGSSLYSVSLPRLALNEGERISGVKIALVGARVSAVNTVPDDWFVEIQPPISGESLLTMSANHGLSWLATTDRLDHFVTVATDDHTKPALPATVTVSTAKGDREIALRPGDLRPEPLSRL
jgi:hypothetical protein